MKSKTVTNEDLLKKIEELEKKLTEQRTVVVQPYPYYMQDHSHCTCYQCHPQQYNPYAQPDIHWYSNEVNNRNLVTVGSAYA